MMKVTPTLLKLEAMNKNMRFYNSIVGIVSQKSDNKHNRGDTKLKETIFQTKQAILRKHTFLIIKVNTSIWPLLKIVSFY